MMPTHKETSANRAGLSIQHLTIYCLAMQVYPQNLETTKVTHKHILRRCSVWSVSCESIQSFPLKHRCALYCWPTNDHLVSFGSYVTGMNLNKTSLCFTRLLPTSYWKIPMVKLQQTSPADQRRKTAPGLGSFQACWITSVWNNLSLSIEWEG